MWTSSLPLLAGLDVGVITKAVVENIRNTGMVWKHLTYAHTYMYGHTAACTHGHTAACTHTNAFHEL